MSLNHQTDNDMYTGQYRVTINNINLAIHQITSEFTVKYKDAASNFFYSETYYNNKFFLDFAIGQCNTISTLYG